jgi:hypothetical protein
LVEIAGLRSLGKVAVPSPRGDDDRNQKTLSVFSNADVVERADSRIVQCRDGFNRQHFDRDCPAEAGIPSSIGFTHTAGAERVSRT